MMDKIVVIAAAMILKENCRQVWDHEDEQNHCFECALHDHIKGGCILMLDDPECWQLPEVKA